jgi:hypothetical protein
MSSTPPVSAGRRPLAAILTGGFLGGTFDLLFAFVYYGARSGAKPVRIMQSVAGGLLGRATYEGGPATAALGVLLHYTIATGAAVVFFGLSRFAPVLVRRALPAGIVFGAGIYFVMNMVVVPLSAWHSPAWPPPHDVIAILGHLCIGLLIAFAIKRLAPAPAAKN